MFACAASRGRTAHVCYYCQYCFSVLAQGGRRTARGWLAVVGTYALGHHEYPSRGCALRTECACLQAYLVFDKTMSGSGRGNTLGGGPASGPPTPTSGRSSTPCTGRTCDRNNNTSASPSSTPTRYRPDPSWLLDRTDGMYRHRWLSKLSSLVSPNSRWRSPPTSLADDDSADEGESRPAGGERRCAYTCRSHGTLPMWML